MRVVSVVGARSEFVKCAAVSRVLRDNHEEILVHTGEEFDYGTCERFFSDLGLPLPDHNLGLGSGTHAEVTGRMIRGLAPLIKETWPHWVLVYGCSNTTVAGALVATKLGVPVGHVEAGLRSYKRSTPDEMNHIVVDHVSRLHFCPTAHAVSALKQEGLTDGVFQVGDVLLDNVLRTFHRASSGIHEGPLLNAVGLNEGQDFAYATIHHIENTDDEARLAALIQAFSNLSMPVLLPLHPRTQESLMNHPYVASQIGPNVNIVDPLRPIESLSLVARARVVLTDSGGLQREAYFIGVPCIILRDDTEWVDTLDVSANVVVGADAETILKAVESAAAKPRRGKLIGRDSPFGDGRAGAKVVSILENA